MLVLSSREAAILLNAAQQNRPVVRVTLNLGKDEADVIIEQNEFLFPGHTHLSVQDMKTIAMTDNVCFLLADNTAEKIQFFSPDTNKFYKLYPTTDWPTLEISGIRMHRVTKITPKQDTDMKIKLVSPVSGNCLDTCTGLGYTAIGLLQAGAKSVITVEKDSCCLEIARHNPWSQDLFTSKAIKLMSGDIDKKIKTLKDQTCEKIIHDPPSFSLAGELYSLDLYKQLYRVMKARGKMFHYTGRPGAVRNKRDLIGEVARRLKQAGFQVKREDTALGVVAWK